jgi:ParB-like chromosome segregation protein Spo0J
MKAKELSNAPVEHILISKIGTGPNLRAKVGSVVELRDSIVDLGLIHPVVVTDDQDKATQHGKAYTMIAGHRRLQAAVLAKMTRIPARVIRGLAVGELLEIQRDENEQRVDLEAYAASLPRFEAVEKRWLEIVSQLSESDRKREVTKASVRAPQESALTDARRDVGVPPNQAQRDARIVGIVRKYPELERYAQRPLLSVAEALKSMDPEERKQMRTFVAAFDRKDGPDVAKAVGNLVDRWPGALRKKLYRLVKTDPEQAMTAALELPPVPDERFLALGRLVDDLKQVMSQYRARDEAQSELVQAKKHMDEAYTILRRAYELKRDEFAEVVS